VLPDGAGERGPIVKFMSYQGRTLRRLVLAANALSPVKNSPVLTVPSFFASWITSEATVPMLMLDAADTAAFVAKGGWKTTSGKVALAGRALGAVALFKLLAESKETDRQFEAALEGYRSPEQEAQRPRSDRRGEILPVFNEFQNRRRITNIPYTEANSASNRLDVYLPLGENDTGRPRPIVMYIHGGGWVIGDKREQGIPILNHMAANGWVGFNVNYRLSPKHKAPAHLVDAKRALIWIREHAADYDADPNFVAVIGNSAGGHLCALVALTENDPEFQPGFEDANTSVQAAVPFYGVYDMADREQLYGSNQFLRFIESAVVGATVTDAPDRFAAYSPVDQIHESAPPMMMVHGSRDVLVPVAGARTFAAKLKAISKNPAIYAELQGAQHAFDVFTSPRTVRTVEWVQQFLAETYERHLAKLSTSAPNPNPAQASV
jgi:acetyl esterase/lipase